MQKPKGTKDNYGKIEQLRNFVERTIEKISETFNFSKIETPIFESKDVFVRSVGETSDIVTKEMYEFEDKGGRNLVLRPEGTAGLIRSVVENKLYSKLPLKLYYFGPMFRYENPQKGRQRQFTQFGVEFIGEKSPLFDAETILLAATILEAFKIKTVLKINFLGSLETRKKWSKDLKTYFEKYKDQLEAKSLERIEKNPMRILDDKLESKKKFVLEAPKISQYLSDDEKDYFAKLLDFLRNMQIDFVLDENLVRGLDYYSDTAFEFVSDSDKSGSQDTIIGGGRYDNLIQEFGGPNLSGIGFGLGIERFINEIEDTIDEENYNSPIDVYVMPLTDEVCASSLGIVYVLRKLGIKTEWNGKGQKITKQLEKADKLGAKVKIIVGENDLENNQVTIKDGKNQINVSLEEIPVEVMTLLGEENEKN